MRLRDKTALVTGGAAGFGAEIAAVFAREGAKVIILDLNGAAAAETEERIGEAARAVEGDVTRAADIERAVAEAQSFGGRLDIVVNNAGWTHRNKPMLEVSEDEFDRVYAINVKSIFHMATAAVPVMREQGGGVMLNIGSTAGIRPRPGLTWYNSTKGAVNLLSRSMAVELAPDRIRVNCVAPVMGAREPREVHRHRPARPAGRAVGRGGRVPLPCLGRGRLHHGGRAGGRRRQDDLSGPFAGRGTGATMRGRG